MFRAAFRDRLQARSNDRGRAPFSSRCPDRRRPAAFQARIQSPEKESAGTRGVRMPADLGEETGETFAERVVSQRPLRVAGPLTPLSHSVRTRWSWIPKA